MSLTGLTNSLRRCPLRFVVKSAHEENLNTCSGAAAETGAGGEATENWGPKEVHLATEHLISGEVFQKPARPDAVNYISIISLKKPSQCLKECSYENIDIQFTFQSSFDSRPSSMRPRPSSVSRLSSQRSSQPRTRPASARPAEGSRKTNFIKRNIQRTSKAGAAAGVESRVKYSRNYQPPRRKKTILIEVGTFCPSLPILQ